MDKRATIQSDGEEPLLQIHQESALSYDTSFAAISQALDQSRKVTLDYAPWPEFPYQPQVQVRLLHSGDCLFLKFDVEEKIVVAAHNSTHAAVYKDSCVEFFLSFDDSGYYNFEFNASGACLAAFGPNRADRQFLPLEAVDQIRRRAVIDREPHSEAVRWSLALVIPLHTFVHHCLSFLTGLSCRANFYKCGDDLPEPHFLSWSPVETPEPDFHQPGYFGTLIFG